MNKFNRKNVGVALLVTMGALFSVNATAAQTPTVESSISEFIVAQGEQMMIDLSAQLQETILEEVNNFSIDLSIEETISDSLSWVSNTENSEADKDIKQSNEEANKKPVTE